MRAPAHATLNHNHTDTMNTADRLSAAIMGAAALVVLIGLPVFSCIRDAKGLTSSAPLCHSEERLSDCLPPLPPLV